jgi:protein-tyrosine phosphatase
LAGSHKKNLFTRWEKMTLGQLRVGVICTGNICRSPMAEVLIRRLVSEDQFLAARVLVSSAGTAKWHVGSPTDARARAALDRAGLLDAGSRGAYADTMYLNAQDLILAMSREHVREARERLTNQETSVVLFRNLLELGLDLDVADPYYGDASDFDDCLALFRRGGPRLIEEFRQRLGEGSPEV